MTTKARARPVKSSQDMWAPPVIEWLSCRGCTTTWHRQVSRGRKPHYCPRCAGSPELPPPVTIG
jgi:hypothetical protein